MDSSAGMSSLDYSASLVNGGTMGYSVKDPLSMISLYARTHSKTPESIIITVPEEESDFERDESPNRTDFERDVSPNRTEYYNNDNAAIETS
jgi:hypothetical protein